MPYVAGPSLRVHLRRRRRLDVGESREIATAVGRALGYAHRHGVIHLDVKPENILLDEAGALLTDFGIATSFLGLRNGLDVGRPGGFTAGTPEYMSPEQITGRALDARSDIYSLACVVYEMLLGRPPFEGDIQCILSAHLCKAAESLDRIRPEVPAPFCRTVERGLARNVESRFAAVEEFLEGLS